MAKADCLENDRGLARPFEGRLLREYRTLRVMTRMHCRAQHAPKGELCDSCEHLLEYARDRLLRCPWGPAKPTCASCPVHCYKPTIREQTRAIMRYSGPRMIWSHPWYAFLHVLDGLRSRKRP